MQSPRTFQTFGNTLASSAAFNAARRLVPTYEFMQKDAFKAVETGKGDCKTVAQIYYSLLNLREDVVSVRHVTKPVKPSSSASTAYIHYLALERNSGLIVHSTGAPLSEPGAHIKAVPVIEFGYGWSLEGEKRAKPFAAIKALEAICEGSDHEVRRFSGSQLELNVENPGDRLDSGGMAQLREESLDKLQEMEI
jgi:hypothetical protein